jgi:hypothetical protein
MGSLVLHVSSPSVGRYYQRLIQAECGVWVDGVLGQELFGVEEGQASCG